MFSWEVDTPLSKPLSMYSTSVWILCLALWKNNGKPGDWVVSPVCSVSLAYLLLQSRAHTWTVFGLLPSMFPEWNWPVVVDVILSLRGLGWNWLKKRVVRLVVEEAGCQACEKLFLGEGVCWEVVFSQRDACTSYRALRILDLACCRDPEREVKYRWIVLVKVYTPKWNRHVRNEIMWVLGSRRLLERILLFSLCSFPVTSA